MHDDGFIKVVYIKLGKGSISTLVLTSIYLKYAGFVWLK